MLYSLSASYDPWTSFKILVAVEAVVEWCKYDKFIGTQWPSLILQLDIYKIQCTNTWSRKKPSKYMCTYHAQKCIDVLIDLFLIKKKKSKFLSVPTSLKFYNFSHTFLFIHWTCNEIKTKLEIFPQIKL